MILDLSCPIVLVPTAVGRDTWDLQTVNKHFHVVPFCICYCGDEVKYW